MTRTYRDVLRDQGRGIAGALIVAGLSFFYTMESWWLGWRLQMGHLVVYAVVGLVGVLVITQQIGFQETAEGETRRTLSWLAADFAELVLQSFVTAYLVLLAFGVVEAGQAPVTVVRMGLLLVVPLGFGAAVANLLLSQSEEDVTEESFPHNVPTYVLGAAFVSFPAAPTEEIAVIAVYAGWPRLAGVVAISVAVAYFVLYELEFRGQRARRESRSWPMQVGSAFFVYVVGVVVAATFLLAFGHFDGTTLEEQVQLTIVLSFMASTGASAGEVVL